MVTGTHDLPSPTRPFAGFGHLLRFMVRRDRLRAPVWIVSVVGIFAASVASVVGLYKTPADLQEYASLAQADVALKAFAGPGYGLDDPTLGAVVMNETLVYTLIAVALMCNFLLIRHTRAEEETDRAELVRAACVGRLAPLAAAVVWVAIIDVVVAVGLALSLLAFDLPATGTLAFAAIRVCHRPGVHRSRDRCRTDRQQCQSGERRSWYDARRVLHDSGGRRSGDRLGDVAVTARMGAVDPGLRRRTVVGAHPVVAGRRRVGCDRRRVVGAARPGRRVLHTAPRPRRGEPAPGDSTRTGDASRAHLADRMDDRPGDPRLLLRAGCRPGGEDARKPSDRRLLRPVRRGHSHRDLPGDDRVDDRLDGVRLHRVDLAAPANRGVRRSSRTGVGDAGEPPQVDDELPDGVSGRDDRGDAGERIGDRARYRRPVGRRRSRSSRCSEPCWRWSLPSSCWRG